MGYCDVCQSAGSVNKFGYCEICGKGHHADASVSVLDLAAATERAEVEAASMRAAGSTDQILATG